MSEPMDIYDDPIPLRPCRRHLPRLQRLGGPGSTAYRLPNGDVLKTGVHQASGHMIGPRDAMLLQAIWEETVIPAPRLLDEWWDLSDDSYYMRIQHIEGVPLREIWDDYGYHEKRDVIEQLQFIVDGIRGWRVSEFIGSVDGGKAPDRCLRSSPQPGPHVSEQAFLSDIYAFFNQAEDPDGALRWIRNENRTGALDTYPEHCRLTAQAMGVWWRDFIFAHGRLTPDNILMRWDGVAGIIDWSEAGYYPVWWDFFKAEMWEKEHPHFAGQRLNDRLFQIEGYVGTLAVWDQDFTTHGRVRIEGSPESESESGSDFESQSD